MSTEARRRAERCFALARSTTFDAERETAVQRGEAIAKAAGLSLDSFDIPGRTKAPPKRPTMRVDLFEGDGSGLEDMLRSFEEALKRRYRTAFNDAFFDAVRQEQRDRAEAWTSERQRAREADPNRSGPAMTRLRCDLALNFLWRKEVRVYPTTDGTKGERLFVIPDESDLEYDEEGIIEVATRRGWTVEATVRSLKTRAGKAEFHCRIAGLSRAECAAMDDAAIIAEAKRRGWEE